MLIGRVVGQLYATQKQSIYEGQRLLVVQPLDLKNEPYGEEVLAIDGVDAGKGDRVLLVQEGWSAMYILGQFNTPVDAAVVGVIDYVHLYDT